MEDLEVWRQYIQKSFKEIWANNLLTADELSYELNLGNVTDKNHIFSINNRYHFSHFIMCKCEKCGLPCSFNLDENEQIFIFNQNTLTCEEIIIKDIIE